MKRSFSSSNIPLSIRPRQRTSSLSRDSEQGRPSYVRQPSFERPPLRSTMNKLSLPRASRTPMQMYRQDSITPQSGMRGMVMSSGSRMSSQTKRHTENASEKKAQAERQHAAICHWLVERGHVDVANGLKPPSIGTFVGCLQLLFESIDPSMQITQATYKETLLAHMKWLGYDGVIAPSLLKSPNTMHSWPQVMALLDWLRDFQEWSEVEPKLVFDGEEDDDDRTTDHTSCTYDYITQKYQKFNNDEDSKTVDLDFRATLNRIHGVDEEALAITKQEIADLQERRKRQEITIAKKTENIESVEVMVKELSNKLASYETEDCLSALETQIELQNTLNEKIDLQVEQQLKNIALLQEQLQRQTLPHDYKIVTQKQLNEYKNTIKNLEESKKFQVKINKQFAEKIAITRKDVEDRVFRTNDKLKELSYFNPNWKAVQLRVVGFMNKDFKDELEELRDEIKRRETEINKQLKDSYLNFVKLDEDKEKTETEIRKKEAKIAEIQDEINVTNTKLKNSKIKNDKIIEEGRLACQKIQKEIDQIVNGHGNVEELQKEHQDLLNAFHKEQNEYRAFQVQSIESIIELRNALPKKLQEVKAAWMEYKKQQVVKEKNFLQVQLEHGEALQKLGPIE